MAKGKDRDRRLEVQGRRTIGEHKRSGLTIREFCRKSRLAESAFYFWRRELERRGVERREAEHEQGKRPSARAAFVPIRVAEAASSGAGAIEIVLSGDRRVHVTPPVDRQALADVLAVLAGQRRR